MNALIKAAQEVIDNASDEGCSDDLTVTSKKAVEQLTKAVKKAYKKPMAIARSVWKCPTCGNEVRLTFEELNDSGSPMCGDDCRHQLRDLVAVEICGEVLPVPFTSCKE